MFTFIVFFIMEDWVAYNGDVHIIVLMMTENHSWNIRSVGNDVFVGVCNYQPPQMYRRYSDVSNWHWGVFRYSLAIEPGAEEYWFAFIESAHISHCNDWFYFLGLGQSGHHFPDDILKCISLYENFIIHISLTFASNWLSESLLPPGLIRRQQV